jgi:hypothetical protein
VIISFIFPKDMACMPSQVLRFRAECMRSKFKPGWGHPFTRRFRSPWLDGHSGILPCWGVRCPALRDERVVAAE